MNQGQLDRLLIWNKNHGARPALRQVLHFVSGHHRRREIKSKGRLRSAGQHSHTVSEDVCALRARTGVSREKRPRVACRRTGHEIHAERPECVPNPPE